ncbi:MAG: excinuclease ABC subunit UvrC [Christensenellales bacterium]|jgi:excinuclease ABC subunit C
MANLRDKIINLPDLSGVYLMRNQEGDIIYIGKARSLRKRVSQYFSSYGTSSDKVIAMMKRVNDFNYIITPTEIDALILENNLIKKHKPYYNILLKDDKSYPFIRIDIKADYPDIKIVRKVLKDGARYFGPYMQGISAKDILELIYGTFAVRSCTLNLSSLPQSHRPCLNYHIKRCMSPCSGRITSEEYRTVIDKVIAFLNGNDRNIRKILENKMLQSAEREEFELALYYKERLNILDKIVRKQVTHLTKDYNLDVFGIADNGLYGAVNMLIIRGGKLLGSENTILYDASLNESAALSEYLSRYYRITSALCDEIIASVKVEADKALIELLSEEHGRKINLTTPIKGVRRELADMADRNARDYLERYTKEKEKKARITLGAIDQLKESLNINSPFHRIECYDISNISGTDKVASMIVFIDGVKTPKLYRRFKIRTVKGADDYMSLAETVSRRFMRLIEGNDESFKALPDLIIIDGGKGQLNASLKAMRETGHNVTMIGLAKKEEIIVRENMPDVILPRNSLALHLVQRIRDESHRFAISYHRKLRNDRLIRSELMKIQDVGAKRVKLLFAHFKSMDNIKSASIEELMKVDNIGNETARKIHDYFKEEKE